MITFADFPFSGDAVATHNGKVIWTNHDSGDCPPDIAFMYVENSYIVDGELVVELVHKKPMLTDVHYFGTGGGCVMYTAKFNDEVWIATDFEEVFSYDCPQAEADKDFQEHNIDYYYHYKTASVPYPTWKDILESVIYAQPADAIEVLERIESYCEWADTTMDETLSPTKKED